MIPRPAMPRPLLPLVLLAFATATIPGSADEAGAGEKSVGSISFANGDRLSGRALGVTGDGLLEWESPDLHNERLPLDMSQILDLSLSGGTSTPNEAAHVATATLTNGDTVRGALVALDQETVILDTPGGGRLSLRRSMTSRLEIATAERVIFSGPIKLEDWTIADGEEDSWRVEDGELISQARASGIGRRFEHGDRVCISFNASWRSSLRMSVLLLSDDGATTQPNHCYEFSINRRTVFLKKRPRGRIIVPSATIPELAEQENARFEFYIDRKQGTIALYVDGKKGQVWNDDRPEPDSFGNWLQFVTNNGYAVRISDLRVTDWKSDKLPDDAVNEDDPELAEEKGPRIHLQNGDILVGQIGEVKDGRLEVITSVTPVRVPLDRMRRVKLTSREDDSYEEPRLMKGDVRAWFEDGSRLTFRLDSLADNKVTGFSQTFGEATFDLDALSRLEFNIYSDKFRALRASRGW